MIPWKYPLCCQSCTCPLHVVQCLKSSAHFVRTTAISACSCPAFTRFHQPPVLSGSPTAYNRSQATEGGAAFARKQSMSLFDTIYQQIGDSSVQQLQNKLSLAHSRTSPLVDKGINLIAESLSTVAQTEHGRQKLYESIRYIDDSFIDHPDELLSLIHI